MIEAFTYTNIFVCLLGASLGTLVGALPSIAPSMAISLSLPILIQLNNPAITLIYITSIMFGAQYGGSTSSILLNIPGEAGSMMSCIDGYKLTQQGKSKLALYTAAIASFIGSMVSLVVFVIGISFMSDVNNYLSAPDYLIIVLFGCYCIVTLTGKNKLHNFQALILGFLFSYIGEDGFGSPRYVIIHGLEDGLNVMMFTVGLFGLTEILCNTKNYDGDAKDKKNSFTFSEMKGIIPVSIRSSIFGSLMGLIPFFSAPTIDMICYRIEKKFFNKDNEIGEGSVRGVAAAEAANNAICQSSLLPIISLGMPTNGMTVLLYVALISCGISFNSDFKGTYGELYNTFLYFIIFCNIVLLFLNSFTINIWIQLLKLPVLILNPIIVIIGITVIYANDNNFITLFLLICICLLGIVFKENKSNYLPMVMGFILGKQFEEYTYRTVKLFNNKWELIFNQPMVELVIIYITSNIIFFLYKKLFLNTKLDIIE
jgi:putative tricarboxylic transport membrane protein